MIFVTEWRKETLEAQVRHFEILQFLFNGRFQDNSFLIKWKKLQRVEKILIPFCFRIIVYDILIRRLISKVYGWLYMHTELQQMKKFIYRQILHKQLESTPKKSFDLHFSKSRFSSIRRIIVKYMNIKWSKIRFKWNCAKWRPVYENDFKIFDCSYKYRSGLKTSCH